MGYYKQLAIQQRDERERGYGTTVDDDDLAACAAKLGGEVDGRFVRCPSPGCDSEDRSCWVRIDPSGHIFIYECDGALGRAYAEVRKKLGVEAPPRKDYSDVIARILSEAQSANGTNVETYLRMRGLTLPPPPALRFHKLLKHTPTNSFYPVMVAERRNQLGEIVAIHRTYLRHDGSGKARIAPVRMDLGPAQGTAIRLSPLSDELLIGEGVETTMSVMQSTGRPGWAAGSAKMMTLLALPPEVRSVTICADGDDPGEQAACAAARMWRAEGRCVKIMRAPRGFDFNDVLTGAYHAQDH